MSELYTGQAARISANLESLNLYQAADQDELQATEDPATRAAIQRRMAGRVGQIEASRRALAVATGEEEEEDSTERTESIRIRLSKDEKENLEALSKKAEKTVSALVRDTFGL